MKTVTTRAELETILGTPDARNAKKERSALHPIDRDWLSASSLCFVATSDATGRLDVSPKGDPTGFLHVLDETTLVIPERPGNRRGDGFHNLLQNPRVGIISLIPGRGDTLRINGRATIVSDAPFFDELIVKNHRPVLAVVVDVEEVFYHCSKAFLRSAAWKPETWTPDAAPARARIAHAIERSDESIETLEEYYGPSYGERIYG